MRELAVRFRLRLLCGLLVFAVGCADDPATPPSEPLVTDGKSLVAELASAYRAMDPGRFESLLADNPGANVVFTFAVTDSAGVTQDSWGTDVESSIHHRMFKPREIPASDPPLLEALWLVSVDVTLTQRTDFVERDELYRSDLNPGGYDPMHWRITSARYSTDVFFHQQGTEFVVNDGDAEFVVIEDLAQDAGTAPRFRLLSWREPCATVAIQSRECWSTVKSLYAK